VHVPHHDAGARAIDPVAEATLTGLDKAVTDGPLPFLSPSSQSRTSASHRRESSSRSQPYVQETVDTLTDVVAAPGIVGGDPIAHSQALIGSLKASAAGSAGSVPVKYRCCTSEVARGARLKPGRRDEGAS